ncbi:MAG: type II/IV secretion system ATPase subunit [Candidatus Bathyarchaeota archaeon]|jgi:flagellar protein FlaI|nr:type II/IV secretion system ATPase subunit [Candidatus Bathyarchaeota archaeon]
MESTQTEATNQSDLIEERDLKFEQLPGFNEEWTKRTEKNPHLKEYILKIYKEIHQVPTLALTLSRDMGAIKRPNIIYPVGDPIFIHIYAQGEEKNTLYMPIEPRLKNDRVLILNEVEKRIAFLIDQKSVFKSIEEKTEYLNKVLDKMIKISPITQLDELRPNPKKDGKKPLLSFGGKTDKIKLDKDTVERLRFEIFCEKLGSSILEPMIRDIYMEDIHCSGTGPLYVSHKIFGTLESTIILNTNEELDAFVLRLSEIVGKPASHRDPIIDATMPDGSRVNLVFGEDVSRRGSNFTIRKFALNPISVAELIKFGTFSSLVAAYIWILLEEKMSLWICGETASGKTTTLSAITAFMPETYKVVSIEEVPEVYVPHKNWVREVVRETGNSASEEQGAVSMFQLLKAALRQRPDYIIVGEVRGVEGNIAFQAMQTGHPSIATFHAASVSKLVQRLTNYPINIPKTHIDNLNAALFQSAVHDSATGRYKRRVLSLNEILGYEPVEGIFNFVEVFSFDASKDKHEFRGLGTSYLLDSKIAVMRGFDSQNTKLLYEEMFQRAEILEYLIVLGILSYKDVLDNILMVKRMGVKEAHAFLRGKAIQKMGAKIEDDIRKKVRS